MDFRTPGLLCHGLQQQISRWADATDVLSLLKKFDISYLPLRFVAVMVLAHISYAGTRLTLMLYALRQGASQLEVGVIISLLMLVPALTSLKIGRWTDRAGFMPPALAGMALMVSAIAPLEPFQDRGIGANPGSPNRASLGSANGASP